MAESLDCATKLLDRLLTKDVIRYILEILDVRLKKPTARSAKDVQVGDFVCIKKEAVLDKVGIIRGMLLSEREKTVLLVIARNFDFDDVALTCDTPVEIYQAQRPSINK